MEKQLQRLQAIATGKLEAEKDVFIEMQIDPFFVSNMPQADQQLLRADLGNLCGSAMIWHYPRDDKGRMELGKTILLATYPDGIECKYNSRSQWLLAEGPARRREHQRLTTMMRLTTGEHFEHLWYRERWMWDKRQPRTDIYKCWGIEDKPKAIRATELLTNGSIIEALQMYGIELDQQLESLLEGKDTTPDESQYTKVWTLRLMEQLKRCAPWQLAELWDRERRAREVWAKVKPNRKVEDKPIALFGLGGVSTPTRPQVFLTKVSSDKYKLAHEWSGTQVVAASPDWQRPIDFDLLQNGLIAESDIPNSN